MDTNLMAYNFLQLDNDLFLIINGKHNQFLDVFMLGISYNMLMWIPLFILMSYILIKSFKMASSVRLVLNESLLLLFGFLLFAICFYVIPPFIENLIPRLRPSYNSEIASFVHLIKDGPINKFGLFAPRACFASSIASFLFFALRDQYIGIKILSFSWVILISYSKIYCGVHYPSNVIVSDMLGIGFGFLLFRSFFYVKNTFLAI
jgi:undecaprenyl-diphosphatase